MKLAVVWQRFVRKRARGLIGKVVMDDLNENPEYYRDQTTQQALEETERFIQEIQTLARNKTRRISRCNSAFHS